MEYLKIIFAVLLLLIFFVGVAVLKIVIQNRKKKTNTCTNPDVKDTGAVCSSCSLTELCNYKDEKK